jgi:hypothetical protein
MKKADWLILLSIALISYTLLYFFKLPGPSQPQTTPPPKEIVQPVVQPEVKPPEVTKPEVKEPETIKQEMPETVVFESTKGNVTFNHSKHAEGYACTDCHHKMQEGDTIKRCRECHPNPFAFFHNKSSIHSCVGCHTKAGAGPSYTPCSGCHKK